MCWRKSEEARVAESERVMWREGGGEGKEGMGQVVQGLMGLGKVLGF